MRVRVRVCVCVRARACGCPFSVLTLCRSYLTFGKPMAIIAAADRKLSPAQVAVHGTKLCARNGQDLTSSSNEKWARCIVNNLLRQHVGVSLMFFRQAYEVLCLPICVCPLLLLTRKLQGVGRKIGLKLDRRIAEQSRAREMLALLEAHSLATSLEEYALDADVFRGLSTEDRASWALIGEQFNSFFLFPNSNAAQELRSTRKYTKTSSWSFKM